VLQRRNNVRCVYILRARDRNVWWWPRNQGRSLGDIVNLRKLVLSARGLAVQDVAKTLTCVSCLSTLSIAPEA